MTLLFREHKGSFQESMKTIHKIKNVTELGNVTLQNYGFDKRLNSETIIVLKDSIPIGFITKENC